MTANPFVLKPHSSTMLNPLLGVFRRTLTFLLGSLSQKASQIESAYRYYNACLTTIKNEKLTNEFQREINASNIALLKKKIASLRQQ